MSRGPGIRQREILSAVAKHGAVGITGPDDTPAQAAAYRRAAYRLEEDGKITLRSHHIAGRPRLVAYPPDAQDVPEEFKVMGVDGKEYRQPARPPVKIG